MEKSALVIDTPKKCKDCPFFYQEGWNEGNPCGDCDGTLSVYDDMGWIENGNVIPEWCPLIPIKEITGKELKIDKEVY